MGGKKISEKTHTYVYVKLGREAFCAWKFLDLREHKKFVELLGSTFAFESEENSIFYSYPPGIMV